MFENPCFSKYWENCRDNIVVQGFGQCHLHFLYKVIVIVRIVFGCVFDTFYSGEDLKHGGAHICVYITLCYIMPKFNAPAYLFLPIQWKNNNDSRSTFWRLCWRSNIWKQGSWNLQASYICCWLLYSIKQRIFQNSLWRSEKQNMNTNIYFKSSTL